MANKRQQEKIKLWTIALGGLIKIIFVNILHLNASVFCTIMTEYVICPCVTAVKAWPNS